MLVDNITSEKTVHNVNVNIEKFLNIKALDYTRSIMADSVD